MSEGIRERPGTFAGGIRTERKSEPKELIERLIRLAEGGLPQIFDEKAQLFCYRRRQTENGLKNEGSSRRYTIITLLGVSRLKEYGRLSSILLQEIQTKFLRNETTLNQIDNIGDLGLLIWLFALSNPEKLVNLLKIVDLRKPLGYYGDAERGMTTELAWFLAGLSHAAIVLEKRVEGMDKLALRTYEILKQNYGGKGIFRHMANSNLTGRLRGRIGCFADQVYPIYALSKFSRAYDNKEALGIAVECGNTICNLQGTLGQWWWHYDATTGRVTGRYPVYAVHQDGMAPMALFALGEVTGLDFRANIYKGLEWITGENELGINLVDESRNLIWRSFYLKKYRMYCEEVLSLAGIKHDKERNNNLKVLYECRPYHLGWLLYAFTGTRD